MKTIRYLAPAKDSSGYASAARNYIACLARTGINLTVENITFERQHTNHGTLSTITNAYMNRHIKWDINILHCTPENWPARLEKNKYNIGYTAWETNRLPKDWPALINKVNEVWIPSTWNKQVLEESGVTIPIRVIPHTIDEKILKENIDSNYGLPQDKFKFYSIFQWTNRKNPAALLKAYFEEFSANEDVCLVLKTYNLGWDLDNQNVIKEDIRTIKSQISNKNPAPIMFIGNLLTNKDITNIHNSCNCFVLPHRGEGFGLPIAEAMMFSKPVITTGWSGNMDFTTKDNSYLVDYTLVPVGGMPWGKYTSDQLWAEPSVEHLRKQMREVFSNREKAKEMGTHGYQTVKDLCSYEKVGSLMTEYLGAI